MTKMFNNYVGKAGQLFVMSEFLMLGWNVAIPEVDRGDDIFAVKDEQGELWRVQVKTARAQPSRNGYTAQFNIPYQQLVQPLDVEIHFVFLIRNQQAWSDTLIVRRDDLAIELIDTLEKQNRRSDSITMRLNVRDTGVFYGSSELTQYRNLTNCFPQIIH